MPIEITNQYTYSGPVKVRIYTEHELATALEPQIEIAAFDVVKEEERKESSNADQGR